MGYKIGVDGGGTKTECILVDAGGAVVARHLAPGSNPSIVGPEESRRIVAEALAALTGGLSAPISALLICAAGSRLFWREFARSLMGFGRVESLDDSLPILELATDGGPGLVLHSGTGSFVAARTVAGSAAGAGVHYAGGLGWQFGDPGSGSDLGRRAVARGLLELQGWKAASRLGKLLGETTGLAGGDANIRHFYTGTVPNPQLAALAPAVLRLAADGDAAAAALAVESALGLLDLAIDVAAKLFPAAPPHSVRAGLSGPILNHPAVLPALTARSPFLLAPITAAPIEGVRRLLARL